MDSRSAFANSTKETLRNHIFIVIKDIRITSNWLINHIFTFKRGFKKNTLKEISLKIYYLYKI